jgi:hypothetical protein
MRFIVRALAVSAVALPLVAAAQGAPKPPQAAGGGKTELTWYGHAAFVLMTPGGTVLAIDPWLTNPIRPTRRRPRSSPRSTTSS